jgi:nucleotide-binding universal stress UspA family protein
METLQVRAALSLKKILVAADFSAVSKIALHYAAALAERHGSKMFVAHVLSPTPRNFIPTEPLPPELDTDRNQAAVELKDFAADSSLDHVDHETILERGPILDVLSEIIEKQDIDLLVLGTHGRGGIRTLLMGSVAETIFRQVACPVLTVGPSVPAQLRNAGHVHQILFATDFGSASLEALPYAISLAQGDNAKLILLHVLPAISTFDAGLYWYSSADVIAQQKPMHEKAVAQLTRLMPEGHNLTCKPDFVVTFDNLPWGILNVADERQADLIVMGVNRSPFARAGAHVPWAITHEVVRHAKCPVLTVRS